MGKLLLIELLKIRFPHYDEKELFAAVLRGEVEVDGEKMIKPGAGVEPSSSLVLRSVSRRYVSRGGGKLAHALSIWRLSVEGKIFLDAGCSTGGFTDCLLQHGASLVYSVDVGYNQLDWRLRADSRVVARERTNVMDLSPADFDPAPDQAVADLSFRSMRRAAAHILGLTTDGMGIFLVKPQFEWMDPPSAFRGVVEKPGQILEILLPLLAELSREGVSPLKALLSPMLGRKGNREFLFLFSNREKTGEDMERLLKELIRE
jgi:23S rRNA (cytidine1920-2'-O)/16S rRNA (cytidine1409-2'-O)-methyltransferase